jgi:hypothetical protein
MGSLSKLADADGHEGDEAKEQAADSDKVYLFLQPLTLLGLALQC